ncbi:hypothetical protein CKY39_19595 [Variovorax boronicumulans]|uniref:XRE family transcriptional regulator n=1 Tax=Variovorax boronicumulans TaxID=436515 RepID=A0A250DLC2_9BURK|nr:hypothetical protein [Variovorax boronicumulans]ATA55168.1 hypothetical protein CKY39_19595 [Variovorax boronicumulans]
MSLVFSIDAAAEIAGSQNKLAEMLGIKGPNLSEMRNGKRACPIGMRARIATIAGHDTTRAILEGLADKLDPNDEYEKQALLQLSALINAFPEEGEHEKNPVNPKINGASSHWRNRS